MTRAVQVLPLNTIKTFARSRNSVAFGYFTTVTVNKDILYLKATVRALRKLVADLA